jgi:hypothetical protein
VFRSAAGTGWLKRNESACASVVGIVQRQA